MAALADAERKARSIVNKWAAGAALIGWVPGSTLVLTPGDVVMAKAIANIFKVSDHDAEGVLAAAAGAIVGRTAAELLSIVPVFGWIVKAGVAAGTTKAVGEAVIAHYKSLSSFY